MLFPILYFGSIGLESFREKFKKLFDKSKVVVENDIVYSDRSLNTIVNINNFTNKITD